MEFSEIVTAFLSDYTSLLLTSIVIIFQYRTLWDAFLPNERRHEAIREMNKIKSNKEWFKAFFRLFWRDILMTILIIALAIIFIILYRVPTTLVIHVLAIWILSSLFIWKLPIIRNSIVTKNFAAIAVGVFLVIMILQGIAGIKVSQVTDQKKYYGTKIYFLEKPPMVSDSLNYYIGKTQNYMFIYHEKGKYTEVYPMDNITKIVFKN